MGDRVVLAYSGGLDTSVAVKWLQKELGLDVITVAADVGQGGDWDSIKERALKAGAIESIVLDLKSEYADEYLAPAIKANALYEGRYPLVSALSRPIIVKHQVDIARKFGAKAVAHGCTGKGNDQVRFEVSTAALAPELDVIAPVRSWGMTREDSIAYAKAEGIEVFATKASPYSIDDNLWGRAIECGVLEDPWVSPPEDVWDLTRITAESDRELILGFEAGIPVSLDGQALSLADLTAQLGSIIGSYGWGRLDMVENRRVGIKSREVYECPASLAIIMAHQDLEATNLERDLAHEKQRLEPRYAELVYDGLWFSPLREALDQFMDKANERVTGEVRIACEKPGETSKGTATPGRVYVAGRRSPFSLYSEELATYGSGDTFRHEDSEGFVRLWGLGLKTWASRSGDLSR